MIRFWCQCGRQLKASENLIGQPAQCPLCRRLTIVPESDVPRTADFPPVPPRGNINASGEITRGAPAAQVATHPVPMPAQEAPTPPRLSGLALKIGSPLLIDALAIVALYWAVHRVQEAAAKMREKNNLKQIGMAMHNFHDNNNHFPAGAAYRTKDGKPGLSWRVAIIPYMEADPLYSQFKFNEPWDSPHNIRLLPEMPRYYLQPGQQDDGSGMTYYQVFVGPGTAFEEPSPRLIAPIFSRRHPLPECGLSLSRFTNPSNTILVATARNPVPWTKPDDLPYHPDKPLPPLSERF